MSVVLALRRLRREQGSLPTVVVIGAQRAGTTSLYTYLAGHPQMRSPVQKEIQFLTVAWPKGEAWYRRHFPVLQAGERTFEASPYYLFHPAAPARAAQVLPETRFVALLREPVSRAWSHFQLNKANGLEDLSFPEALAAEGARLAEDARVVAEGGVGRHHRLHSYLARGRYADQVQRWRDAVGDRLLVVRSEELFADPGATFSRVLDFVGMPAWSPPSFEVSNRFRASTGERLDPAFAQELRARFGPDNARLAEMLGWDLSAWS